MHVHGHLERSLEFGNIINVKSDFDNLFSDNI